MKIIFRIIFIALIFIPLIIRAQVISPDKYLGYSIGSRYTHYDRLLDYFRMLDSASDNLLMINYGYTCEHRPQFIAVISSPENLKNIEDIRKTNLSLAGLENPPAPVSPKLVIWLSYNVHGNEASSSEAAMETAWKLLSHEQVPSGDWMDKSVVILAPCLNPDGRERYINWFEQKTGIIPDPDPVSEEHHEPWPGGRGNHYLFDLNRDWVWRTQTETQNLVKLYNSWLPQIHVDFHEQEINNPYYFAPAAKPYHELITPWQKLFQKMIGENNARHFDENSWLYFTRERFDLFYPGYGDTYPAFNGSIGMTFEEAGGYQSGLAVITETGDTLTLKDRVMHHTASGISTIEVAVNNASDLIENFRRYFNYRSAEAKPKFNAFVISANNPSYKMDKLSDLLNSHKISFGYSIETKSVQGYDYSKMGYYRINVHSGDLIIPLQQPKFRLAEVLFEPEARLEDSLTYDITAWSIPFAFGLEAYATSESVNYSGELPARQNISSSVPENLYALAIPRSDMNDIKMMVSLLKSRVVVRSNSNPVQFRGMQFQRGSFFISKADNQDINIRDLFNRFSKLYPGRLVPLTSGLAQSGEDLGSPGYKLLKDPGIGLITGDGAYSSECGEVWFFLENELGFPVHRINAAYLKNTDWSALNVLIFPSGNYENIMDDNLITLLKKWIGDGGRLILMGKSLSDFAGKEGFEIKTRPESKSDSIQRLSSNVLNAVKYADKDRMDLKDVISGGIYRVDIDNTHPLAYGYTNTYYCMKLSTNRYNLLNKGWNVGKINNPQSRISGFAGSRINQQMNNLLEFGVENIGSGEVIYMVDDPLFRDFWEDGKMLFANAVFMP